MWILIYCMVNVILITSIQSSEVCSQTSTQSDSIIVQEPCDQTCDDPFLSQLLEVMQKEKDDTEYDKLDLINDIASYENDKNCVGFLYTYMAPYYVAFLVWCNRMKEYVTSIFDIYSYKKE